MSEKQRQDIEKQRQQIEKQRQDLENQSREIEEQRQQIEKMFGHPVEDLEQPSENKNHDVVENSPEILSKL